MPLTISLAIVQLATRVIELRVKHYEVNPELLKQDADNALLWGEWGQRLMKAVDRLFDAIGED